MKASVPLVLSFGSINMDLTARVRRLPAPGETVHAESYAVGLGGKGSNQAAAAARLGKKLGVQVALAGRVGQDAFGLQSRETLTRFGVDLAPLRDDPDNPTGIALIGVDALGENCITVAGGANGAVDETDVAEAGPWLDKAHVLLLQLEIPQAAVLGAARRVRQAGGTVILDPAPAPEQGLLDALWSESDIITPNETETFSLTGILPAAPEEAARAAAVLLSRGARAVVVKMGARGVYWTDGTHEGHWPPFPVVPVDTVAAGDCFNAGLAVALAAGKTLGEAVRLAAACGALATTRVGAAEAAPEWEEVAQMMELSLEAMATR